MHTRFHQISALVSLILLHFLRLSATAHSLLQLLSGIIAIYVKYKIVIFVYLQFLIQRNNFYFTQLFTEALVLLLLFLNISENLAIK